MRLTKKVYGPPRKLTEEDISGFFPDGSHFDREPRPRTVKALRAYLRRRNRWRYARLVRDLAWAEKELGKLGLNPKDARWYL